jgi:DNA mismatch repair protein MutS
MSDQASYTAPQQNLPPAAHSVPLIPVEMTLTPMMAQYMEIKAANPDSLLFYRMGDFYELFFSDAEIASRALGIVLTKRGKHQGHDIPMCGVPIDRADDYLSRLIALDHRVAVCEQLEDPAEAKKRGAKSVVKRDVVRLVTPGTVTEESLLDPASSSLLLAFTRTRLSEEQWLYGLAALDLTTGRFDLSSCSEAEIGAEWARLDPKEIVTLQSLRDDPALASLWRETRAAITPLPRENVDQQEGQSRIKEYFQIEALDAMGDISPVEYAAAGLALIYVKRTQKAARPVLRLPCHNNMAQGFKSHGLMIDAATRANLELTRTLSGERAGSLLSILDKTVTPSGARLLAERLASPLTDLAQITSRCDAIAFLLDHSGLRLSIRSILKKTPDMARSLSRLSLGRGGPRDLAALRDGIAASHELVALIPEDVPFDLATARCALLGMDDALAQLLNRALLEDVPLIKRDGGFIRPGFDAELDKARILQGDSRAIIAALQARYAQETGCRALKIKYNNMLGYFIEVPQAAGEDFTKGEWKDLFIHRQSMAGAMRFSTLELGRLDAEIASAGARALALELAAFESFVEQARSHASSIAAICDALAMLDVAGALAELASFEGWVRPHVDDTLAFHIEQGRHPVVEAARKREGKPFVPNDVDLSPLNGQDFGCIKLLTGPNMGGKSTYLRQNALITILAQIGSFVPAGSAHIGIVDRLFSRVGAADDLARGLSTFMVEMVETATILTQATERSLVILDEIGRGTSTFDGLAIAFATVENLHERNQCRGLFATHFHELTSLASRLPRLSNATMRVREWKGDVVFLHEVGAGVADRSYGIQVARLAGMPPTVVERAKTILKELERSEQGRPRKFIMDDLPLFSVAAKEEPESSKLEDALRAFQPDQMSPREALDALYALKKLLKADGF